MTNKNIPYLDEWLKLATDGKFAKAQELYYESLFEEIIENFAENCKDLIPYDGVLFSILGFSPEPIILTAKAIRPLKHIIFTTNNKDDGDLYLEKFLETNFEMVFIRDENFETVYKALKENLILHSNSNITLDITGGKKSLVAAASIFGKDYGCRIVYVDFSEYIKELRKPLPGSEILTVVYDPLLNQPELFLK